MLSRRRLCREAYSACAGDKVGRNGEKKAVRRKQRLSDTRRWDDALVTLTAQGGLVLSDRSELGVAPL